ncbi:phosphotransferase family protein [Candidatus Pristimantibacillus sp. PTI5]|uniref:phosphotransferase family protein n=1 Tax=Candidatus Pristimantibacillus sp. PTI5 TaxID=3400422 RepID=UPI003B024C45
MHSIIKPDGRINDEKVWRRELLYQGMNGSCVERVYVTASESLVFKPLTNNEQLGKEIWVNEHILSAFPPIYPRIIAHSLSANPSLNWILYEDLGELTHVFEEKTAIGLISYMAKWHALPISHLQHAPLRGPKPTAEAVRAELLQLWQAEDPEQLWPGIPSSLCRHLLAMLQTESFAADELLLSHGDLHLGNYARVNGQIKVLDWEHAHLNLRYWDLYHVIDLSHPLFPKDMTTAIRERLLDHYLELSAQYGKRIDPRSFKHGYYLFASLYSLWMLRLIASDIRTNKGIWPLNQLEQQHIETSSNLRQIAEFL